MASMLDSIMGQLGGDMMGSISKQTGVPSNVIQSAIPAVVALLTGALANNASKKQGASSLTGALKNDHDGSIMNDLPKYINNYQEGPGTGILKHALGDRQSTVQKGLSKSTGIDKKAIGNLLIMLAPVIMGVVGNVLQKKKLDSTGVSKYLGKEQKKIQKQAPQSSSFLSGLLDSNQDGQVIDDVGNIGISLLGEFLKNK
ncbi:MAG: DUF937 domain-containing protein [Actinobacteria bacterium]|nr:DUF937 domain-containing protein [Actinomycetota bacterium]